jgi:hypothetical protein
MGHRLPPVLAMVTTLAAVAMVAVASPARGSVTVTDNATRAGIAQTVQSFDTAVADYNGDGRQDFLFSPQNGGPRQLWRQAADGTFQKRLTLRWSASTSDQHGCTWADADQNGLLDVYCTLGAMHANRTKQNNLWMQTKPGTFADEAVAAGVDDAPGRGYSATFFDANNDGWPDLFVDNNFPRPDGLPTPNRLFLNLGEDSGGHWFGFQDQPESGLEKEEGGRGCDLATDFNRDGLQDLVFCGKGTVHMYQNNGDGTFTDVHQAYIGAAKWSAADLKFADVNGDGLRDLVFIRATQVGVRLAKANQTVFLGASQVKTLNAGRMVDVGDFNGDGLLDLYALQGNGAPGCMISDCPDNHTDYLYPGTSPGKFSTTPISIDAAGSGDTVNSILVAGQLNMIVANGANLTNGPIQLLAVTP